MKLIGKIFNWIKYAVCLAFIMVLGLITLPLTLFFKWDGIFILFILNKESCSLAEAKRLLIEDDRYKVKRKGSLLCGDENINALALRRDASDQFTHPMYSYLNTNINSEYYNGKAIGE